MISSNVDWICVCGEKEIVMEIQIPAGRILVCSCTDPKCEYSAVIQVFGACKNEHLEDSYPHLGSVDLAKYLGRKEEE